MNSSKNQISVHLLFLVVMLLAACNVFGDTQPEQPADTGANSSGGGATLELPLPTATPVPPATATSDQSSTDDSGDAQSSDSEQTELGGVEPEIGEITFAEGVTADYEPIGPNLFFTTGITEVHAVFDYSGMSPDYSWERVWYLNDNEVARFTEAWAGPEAGVFDDFITNSGQPLPAGDWVLEVYVEGELHSLGVFIIEDAE